MKHPQHLCENKFKVSVIGCGNVGATAAFTMLLEGSPTELVLIDAVKDRAQGLLMDFEHTLSFVPYTALTASDKLSATADSNLIVVTAGARQKEGQSRLDLINENKKIFDKIIPELAKNSPEAILLIISNPVDILTHHALKVSKFPANRVFGSGTMLDSIRLQYHISRKLKVNPRDVRAFILGEHGDSSFPIWNSANIAGKSLFKFPKFTQKIADKCYDDTKNAAYRIIHDMGYTCYSIAVVVREIMSAIFQDAQIVVPLSVELKGEYGLRDVVLSIPCVLGAHGVIEKIEIPLNAKEKKQLQNSAKLLKQYSK